MECVDCVTVTARLHLYIDRELSEDEVTIVQQHLTSCPRCECRFHFDMHIKRLIHERCTIAHAPNHLREAVLRLARGDHSAVSPQVEQELRLDLGGS